MRTIARILVPLDASEMAQHALEFALRTADLYGAHLLVMHIASDPASLDPLDPKASEVDLDVIERDTVDLRGAALRLAERLELGIGGDRIEAEIRSGPVTTILHEAVEEHRIDLIVMATHGRKGLAEQLTGSTTEQIVAKSPASVVVLKPEGFPYLRD